MVLFAMFGSLMFVTKIILEFLPNIHLVSMFTILLTVVYRKKALIPIYIFVLLQGIYAGFSIWWIPYLYIFTILWATTMLLPKNLDKKKAKLIYPILCMAHGLLFGTLYAPTQALFYSLSCEATIAWIIAGLPFDIIHGISNFILGFFIYPLSQTLLKLSNKRNNFP